MKQEKQLDYFKYVGTDQRLEPFPDDTGKYQPLLALWLSHCAALAYESQSRIVKELKAAGFDKVTFFDSGGAQAFLAEHPGLESSPFCVLSFRGTENDYKDILTDITIIKRTLSQEESAFRVHGGFLTSLQNILGTHISEDLSTGQDMEVMVMGVPGIRDALVARKRPNSRLYITGHSLGGALATLAAFVCAPIAKDNFKALYTIGSPRVGGLAFARHHTCARKYQIYRIVNSADIVPRVPMSILWYRHVGDYLYLTRNGQLKNPGSFFHSLFDVGFFQGTFLIGSCIVLQRLLKIACDKWLLWEINLPYSNEIIGAVLTVALFALVFIMLPKIIAMLPGRILRWWKLSAISDHSTQAYRKKLDQLARTDWGSNRLRVSKGSVEVKVV